MPTKEEGEEVRGAENEEQGMEVDELKQGNRWRLFDVRSSRPASSRRVICVESEETQDYVRDSLAISQEEADEIGFVKCFK